MILYQLISDRLYRECSIIHPTNHHTMARVCEVLLCSNRVRYSMPAEQTMCMTLVVRILSRASLCRWI